MSCRRSLVSLPPNLWISEQISQGVVALRRDQIGPALGAVDVLADAFEDLLDLLVQLGAVGDDQHAGVVTFSRIHLASQTIVRLLPLPWVCQMIPPSRRRMLLGRRTPKYWLCRQVFLMPASNTMKSWISSRTAPCAELEQLRSSGVGGSPRLLVLLPVQVVLLGRLDHAVAQALRCRCRPSQLHRSRRTADELFFWLSRFWRMPSDTETVERFSSSTPSAIPLTYSTTSGRLPCSPAT
jgi:hypothetical protein